jgi:hypothetical protein
MNWIELVLNQHRELEAPLTFYYWAALAALSASVKDNIWLDVQLYKVYPNIYVMLHAKSGLRKGPPINMAKQIVTNVNNTKIITGRSSIQGILKKLSTATSSPGGIINNKAVAFICSSELSSSMVEDKAAMNILTDLYDRNYNTGDWESLLKSETFKLKDPTITILTATNEAHSEQFFEKQDIQGGYFARTFIIYADTENNINSLVEPLKVKPDYKLLSEYVKEVSKLSGAFEPLYHTPAGTYYHDWYNDFARARKDIVDETGTLNRFGDSVIKVAMLLSLAREPKLSISLEAMEESVMQCEKLIGHTRRVTMGKKGRSNYANQKVMIVEKLLAREPHMMTRAMMMEQMHYHLNSSELDEIMRGFDESGYVKIEARGNVMMYVMPDNIVVKLKDHMAGKMVKDK